MTIFRRRTFFKPLIFLTILFTLNKFFAVEAILDCLMPDEKITCRQKASRGKQELQIHLLDVGQSEAVLVLQGGHVMLIDTALPQYGRAICEYLKKLNVSKIDYLLLTHPHIDHIGGASRILRSFEVTQVYFADTRSIFSLHNFFYLDISRVCLFRGVPVAYALAGKQFSFGKSAITLVAPSGQKYRDLNNYSIGIKLNFGAVSALFLGDMQAEAEEALMLSDFDLTCDILKISHHGSITSSTSEFLDAARPRYALLSVCKDNVYGHPTKTVMKRFKERSIPLYRTDELGTVIVTTDGKKIDFNTKTGNYQSRKKK